MSCVRTVKTFEVVEIKLDEIKANDLVELEETLCNVMVQKLEKLNIFPGWLLIASCSDGAETLSPRMT